MEATPPPVAASLATLDPAAALIEGKAALEIYLQWLACTPRWLRTLHSWQGYSSAGVWPGYRAALSPLTFAQCCLGYLSEPAPLAPEPVMVSPWRIIAGTFRKDRDAQYSEDHILQWSKSLWDAFRRGGPLSGQLTTLTRVEGTNLYVVREGTNRIELFRRRGVDVPAVIVGQASYPAPSALEILQFYPIGVTALRNKSTGDVVALPLPHLSVPFLASYGASTRHERSLDVRWWDRVRARRLTLTKATMPIGSQGR